MFTMSTAYSGNSAVHRMPRPISTYFVHSTVVNASINTNAAPKDRNIEVKKGSFPEGSQGTLKAKAVSMPSIGKIVIKETEIRKSDVVRVQYVPKPIVKTEKTTPGYQGKKWPTVYAGGYADLVARGQLMKKKGGE